MKSKLKKHQLTKIWKQLDEACEAIELLGEHGIENENIDFSAIVNLKNDVEEMIISKTRNKKSVI